MKREDYQRQLNDYVEANRPIIYINHFDFKIVDEMIENMAQGVKILEYDNAFGMVNFKGKGKITDNCSLEEFLDEAYETGFSYDNDGDRKPYESVFIILKDVHSHFDNCKVISYLKKIAENHLNNDNFSATIFIVSGNLVIPEELENYITVVEVPLPTDEEIREIISDFSEQYDNCISEDIIGDITIFLKGMNEFHINRVLELLYCKNCFYENDIHSINKLILKEKEQLIKKSGMLEIINFDETVDDIGGLENLKKWLERKAKIFENLDKAIKFGVDVPKGIMIVGMPGCGKSLTAKATASLFKIPLVRLDVGRLLGKYVGESENNLRKALKLSEAISPCVLWIDEIEKAFAGVCGNGGNEVTTRLFGQFLTWMQEKQNTVFIVATANNISKMPPEFLRKGRFDEIFSVDLPNPDERKKILSIHLKNRDKLNKNIDFNALVKEKITDGFNGADLEAVVKETIETAFIEGKKVIETEDLLKVIKNTNSISDILGEVKINKLKNKIEKFKIKSASK